MNCPSCGKTLRALQVKKMLGNPAYNEWCRSGYCSSDCFERSDQDEVRPEVVSMLVTPAEEKIERIESNESEPFRATKAYDLATICLVSVPFAMLISFLARGAYLIPIVGDFVSFMIYAIIAIGFVSGICAICAIPKLGPQRLLWKSIIGLLMIGSLVWALIYAIATANV